MKNYSFKANFILVLVAFCLLLTSCSEKPEEQEVVYDVEVASPTYGNVEIRGDFIGRVEADSTVMIIPKVIGDVTATYFNVGDRVNEGDLLFTMDDTPYQIQLSQAMAGLASAQSNVELNQYNSALTEAQVNQNLGQMSTNQLQLENAVSQAKYAVESANGNIKLAAEQLKIADRNLKDIDDNISELLSNANNQENYAKSLNQIKTIANRISVQSTTYAAVQVASAEGVKSIPAEKTTTTQDIAKYYIYTMTGGKAEDEFDLGMYSNAATSSAQSLRSSSETLEGSRDQLRLAQIQASISADLAKNNYNQAKDAETLAKRMLADYENYTKAVILAGADYQLAGARTQAIAAQSSLTQAQAGVDSARLQISYTKVSAPVSGTITQKNVSANNLASQSSPAYVIMSDEEDAITFSVAQSVMEVINIGDTVLVERNGREYTAKVTENTGIPDAQSGLFKIKALINEKNHSLIPSTTVRVNLVTQKSTNVLLIPVDSVYYENHTAYVYIEKDGVAKKTLVETGITDNTNIEILSGITDTDKIITTWHSQIADGSKVNIKQ